MKTMILVLSTMLGTVVGAQVASAQSKPAKLEYFVKSPWVDKNQRDYKPGDENGCPKIVSVVVESSPDGSSEMLMKLEGDSVLLPRTGDDRQCDSDVVCNTSDSFSTDGKHIAVMTRNNDGRYPYTKNLPGYMDLFTMDISVPRSSPVCYYAIIQ